MPKKTTIFLTDQSREIINQLKIETGETMNSIVNDAIACYGRHDKELEAMMRRVIKEELSLGPSP